MATSPVLPSGAAAQRRALIRHYKDNPPPMGVYAVRCDAAQLVCVRRGEEHEQRVGVGGTDLAGAGKGVLVVSSELPELMALCDRIVVLSLGRVTGEFRAGEWTQEGINAAAFGGHHAGGAS